MLWQDYRVVLLVPLNASGGLKVLATTSACIYHYVCVSVHPSVCNRRLAERFDLRTQDAVSLAIEHYKLELGSLCECQSWH